MSRRYRPLGPVESADLDARVLAVVTTAGADGIGFQPLVRVIAARPDHLAASLGRLVTDGRVERDASLSRSLYVMFRPSGETR